jgi:hypothetical protein
MSAMSGITPIAPPGTGIWETERIAELEKNITTLQDNLTSLRNSVESLTETDVQLVMRYVITIATILLWGLLVGFGVAAVFFPSWQSSFFDSASKVLLPVFNATIVASLAYIFGKPTAHAIAQRINRTARTS